jgi:hypothetical protein
MGNTEPTPPKASVMAGRGYYSRHSESQGAAAAPGFGYLAAAAAAVPLRAERSAPITIADYGCAGGTNEVRPMEILLEGLRARRPSTPINVLHTDLPENDFGSLFALLADPARSYTTGREPVYPLVAGRTLYGPLMPDASLTVGWTAITVHWLSRLPRRIPEGIFASLIDPGSADVLREQSRLDWEAFLTERHRELIPGGEVIVVGGASTDDGRAGAEGLFRMMDDALRTLVASGRLDPGEYEAIFYPTWNRTLAEFLAPFEPGGAVSGALEVVEHSFDITDDALAYPQFVVDGDAQSFAAAYTAFARAITEPSFFRWLRTDRPPGERDAIVGDFYRDLQARVAADPVTATCHWRVATLRIRRPV